MRNPSLLRFLAAVEHHAATTATLMAASDLDPLSLQLAVAEAEERGLVQATGEIHPALRLTAAGREWAAAELAPFKHLIGQLQRDALKVRAA